MAKDLPYFKFFCSEWNDGDITLENYELQGLFINICSYYWSNECELTLQKLEKKFKNVEKIQELIKSDLIKVYDDLISINFLDEQRDERLEQSKIKSKGGKASAEKRRLAKLQQESNTIPTEKQHVLKSCSTEIQLLREEEKRKEKIIVIEELPQTNILTEELFLKRWCDARTYYDKLPTNIKKLTTFEKIDFNELRQDYNLKEFEQAMQGMFQQKTFPKTRLRPTHFLKREHFETYLTCFTTKEKLFDDNKYKKPLERI
tara:strand:+ start:1297 stop:2076 length:780 start_codon:yes stop_codon:yes gene_type:complete